MGSKREKCRRRGKNGKEKEDSRSRNRSKKMKMCNNNIRAENDFVAINHDCSIDSLFWLSEIFLPAVHQPTLQSCMQVCVSCLHIQYVCKTMHENGKIKSEFTSGIHFYDRSLCLPLECCHIANISCSVSFPVTPKEHAGTAFTSLDSSHIDLRSLFCRVIDGGLACPFFTPWAIN